MATGWREILSGGSAATSAASRSSAASGWRDQLGGGGSGGGSDPDLPVELEQLSEARQTVDRDQRVAQSVGIDDPSGDPPEGLISGAFDYLQRPVSAVVGGLSGLAGWDMGEGQEADQPALQEAGSRIKAAISGEQQYGMGESPLFDVGDDAGTLERMAAGAGAFAADVALDPLSYVSFGGTVLGKRAGGEIVQRMSRTKAAREFGEDSLREWADRAPRFRAAREGTEQAREQGDDALGEGAQEALDNAYEPPQTWLDTGGTADQWRTDVIGPDQFGDAAAEAYHQGGPTGLRHWLKTSADEGGAGLGDDAGEEFFAELPRDVQGGLRIRQPFSRGGPGGTPRTIGIGGGGRLAESVAGPQAGRAFERVHQLRNRIRGSALGRSIGDRFGGRLGPVYGQMVRDTYAQDPTDLSRHTYTMYRTAQAAQDEGERAGSQMFQETRDTLGDIESALRHSGADETEARDAFRRWFQARDDANEAMSNASYARGQLPEGPGVDHLTDGEKAGLAAATHAHGFLDSAYDQMRRAGVPVEKIDNYVPRILDQEEALRKARQKPTRPSRGQGGGSGAYAPDAKQRDKYIEVWTDVDEAGNPVAQTRWWEVDEINEAEGRQVFMDDPTAVITAYGDAARRVAVRHRIANVFHEHGALPRGDTEYQRLVSGRPIEELTSALNESDAAMQHQLRQMVADQEQNLDDLRRREQEARQAADEAQREAGRLEQQAESVAVESSRDPATGELPEEIRWSRSDFEEARTTWEVREAEANLREARVAANRQRAEERLAEAEAEHAVSEVDAEHVTSLAALTDESGRPMFNRIVRGDVSRFPVSDTDEARLVEDVLEEAGWQRQTRQLTDEEVEREAARAYMGTDRFRAEGLDETTEMVAPSDEAVESLRRQIVQRTMRAADELPDLEERVGPYASRLGESWEVQPAGSTYTWQGSAGGSPQTRRRATTKVSEPRVYLGDAPTDHRDFAAWTRFIADMEDVGWRLRWHNAREAHRSGWRLDNPQVDGLGEGAARRHEARKVAAARMARDRYGVDPGEPWVAARRLRSDRAIWVARRELSDVSDVVVDEEGVVRGTMSGIRRAAGTLDDADLSGNELQSARAAANRLRQSVDEIEELSGPRASDPAGAVDMWKREGGSTIADADVSEGVREASYWAGTPTSETLYRGLYAGDHMFRNRPPEGGTDLTGNLEVGQEVDLPTSSFTTSEQTARAYSGKTGRIVEVRPGTRAMRLDRYSDEFADEAEYVSEGRFRVAEVDEGRVVLEPVRTGARPDDALPRTDERGVAALAEQEPLRRPRLEDFLDPGPTPGLSRTQRRRIATQAGRRARSDWESALVGQARAGRPVPDYSAATRATREQVEAGQRRVKREARRARDRAEDEAGRRAVREQEVAEQARQADQYLNQLNHEIDQVALNRDRLQETAESVFDIADVDERFEQINTLMRGLNDFHRQLSAKHRERAKQLADRSEQKLEIGQARYAERKAGRAETLGRQMRSGREVNNEYSRWLEDQGLEPVGSRRPDIARTPDLSSPPPELDMSYAPEVFRTTIEKYWRASRPDSEIQGWIDQVYRPWFGLFKLFATVGRGPGYHMRNTIGGVWNNWLRDVSPQDHLLSARLVAARRDAWKDAQRVEAENIAAQAGIPYAQAAEELPVGRVMARAEQNLADELSQHTVYTNDVGEAVTMHDIHKASQMQDVGWNDSRVFEGVHDMLRNNAPERVEDPVAQARTSADAAGWSVKTTGGMPGQVDEPAANLWPAKDPEELNRMQRLANRLADNWWIDVSKDWAATSEDFVRNAAFIRGAREYGLHDGGQSAAVISRGLHFDYQDLSDFERQWMRGTLVPFYIWTRNNIPLQFRALFREPGKMNRIELARENAEIAFGSDDDEAVPSWMQERFGFATKLGWKESEDALLGHELTWDDPEANPVILGIETPAYDLNQFIKFGGNQTVTDRMRPITRMLSPLVSTPMEMASGTSTFTGAPFSSRGVEAPSWYRGATHLLPGEQTWIGSEGKERGSQAWINAVENAIPPLGQFERLSGITQQKRERLATSWLSTMAAMPSATLSPRQETGEMRARSGRLREQINKHPQAAEVARDLLDQGFTPTQIRAMLQETQ